MLVKRVARVAVGGSAGIARVVAGLVEGRNARLERLRQLAAQPLVFRKDCRSLLQDLSFALMELLMKLVHHGSRGLDLAQRLLLLR